MVSATVVRWAAAAAALVALVACGSSGAETAGSSGAETPGSAGDEAAPVVATSGGDAVEGARGGDPEPTTESGTLARGHIRTVVGGAQLTLRACYESGLLQNPSLEGQVNVRFEVQPSGEVVNAQVASSTLDAPDIEGCIVHAIRRLRFDPSDGVSVIQYPFVFRSSAPAE